jgi:acetyl-CoA C-acetyltransferase
VTTDIVIASAAQTLVGSFANTPARLGTVAIKAALNRAKVAAEEVEDVIHGQSPHLDAWQGPTNRHGP